MGEALDLNNASQFKRPPKFSFTSAAMSNDKKTNMPGPGQYAQTTADKDKFIKTPTWSIAGSSRDNGKAWEAYPGPGTYAPASSLFQSPKWIFSSETRLRKLKRSLTPGPGSYDSRGTLEGTQVSICSKPECKSRSQTPGPGAYKPSFEQCSNMLSSTRVSFGAGCRKDLVLSKTPGPGTYDSLTSLGGNCAMRTPPKYSIKGRYEQPPAFQTPGFVPAGSTFK